MGTALDLVLVGSIYHRLTIIAAEQNIRSGPLQLFRAAKPNFAKFRVGVYADEGFHTSARVQGWGGPLIQVEALGGYGLKDFFGDLLAGKFRNAARNFLPMVTGRGGPFLYGRRVDDAAFQANRYAGVFWEGRRFSIPLFVPNGRLAAIGFREVRSGAALEVSRAELWSDL